MRPRVTEAELVALEGAVHARVSPDGFDLARGSLAVKLAAMAANLRAPLEIDTRDAAVDQPADESV